MYDNLLASTLRKYTRTMLTELGVEDAKNMTDEEVKTAINAYLDAPYTCYSCGSLVQPHE